MADDKKTACVFSAEVFGADMARVLNAFAALEVCVSADMLRIGAVAAESVPFARPSGVSMYEADALTWRLYHTHASCAVNAINNAAYGGALARALYACLFAPTAEADTVHILLQCCLRRSTECARPLRRCSVRCASPLT